MIVYKIDEQGNFTGEHNCQVNPETKGWMYPANYTEIQPPELKEFEYSKFDGKKWVISETDRGKTIYNKDNYLHQTLCPEHEAPEGWTKLEPVKDKPCLWEVDKWIIDKAKETDQENQKIISELNKIDMLSIRPLRAKLAGEATKSDDDKLLKLEQDAVLLRDKIK
jgi:hypothetical protein